MGVRQGLGGAASGAAAGSVFGPWGAGIGGVLGGLGGLFGGDDDAGSSQMQAMLDAWTKLRDQANVQYQNPQDTFAQQQDVLGRLNQQSQTGLTDADKYAFWAAKQQAGDFAQQGQGAAQQQAAMQGGGVANSGQNAVMQAQAAQQGANRLMGADMNQAARATQMRYQATRDYMNGLQGLGNQQFRNASALNQFNQQNFGNQMNATAGLSGAYQNQANYQQQQREQRNQDLQGALNSGFKAYGALTNPQRQQQPWMSGDPTGGGGYT